MNTGNVQILELELYNFIDQINHKKQWKLDKTKFCPNLFIKGQLRCMGRIWDSKDWDINKQCSKKAVVDNLCGSCFRRNNSCGIVNEYPNEEIVTKWYRLGISKLQKSVKEINPMLYSKDKYNSLIQIFDRNIDKEIDLNKYEKYIFENKSYKKISNRKNKRMSLNLSSEQTSQIPNLTAPINNYDTNDVISDESTPCSPYSPNSNIIEKIEDSSDLIKQWWESEMTDKVKIYDEINGSSFVFAMVSTNDGSFLLNKKQVILGEFYEWEDSTNKVDISFKNNENIVLHPKSAIPLIEFKLYKEKQIYHDLNATIYREYRYDNTKEELFYTNSIELLM